MDVDDIGEDNAALLCHTNKTNCCKSSLGQIQAGEWYYPNGTRVGIKNIKGIEFYRDRHTRVVRLHHRQGTFVLRGRFSCEVPDANDVNQTVFVNIGM